MVTLETAIKQGIKILETITETKFKDSTKPIRVWKGRKVIPAEKWKSMRNKKGDQYQLLRYIPDDLVQFPFITNADNKALEIKKDKWFKDFLEFLEHTKNEAYGRMRCAGCILQSNNDNKSASFRDAILKACSEHEGEITYPCTVENIFECPHKQGENNHFGLFWLKEILEIVYDALYFANVKTTGDNEIIIQTDFENNSAIIYEDQCRSSYKTNDIASWLNRFRLSRVLVNNMKDTYDVLTNSTKLDLVIEQYIESVEDNYYHDGKKTPESEKKAESMRQQKKGILHFFTQIKDSIKLEDLHNIYNRGKTAREIDREIQTATGQKDDQPETKIINPGSCTSCGHFANINCIKCNIWVCDRHWKEHGVSKHNMKFEEQIT